MAVRARAVARRIDDAIGVEEQAKRAVAARRCGPIDAVAADMAETAIDAVAKTRSRIPYGSCRTKHADEVHAFA